ncbi:MAG TPA: amino acid ABC transporter substrate-binding protein [Burkholderiaceae bacterium]|nr:amino acid ABC transporter substrate-binding protein [Burkholderiaceae bacterium]
MQVRCERILPSRRNALVAAGCAAVAWASGARAQAISSAPPLRIGVSLGVSGAYRNIARFQSRGYALWAKHVNARGGILGRRVEMVIRDDGSDAAAAKKIYETFIEQDKLDFVFGPYSSPVTAAVAPVVDRHGYPMLAAGASSDELWRQRYTNVFGVYASARRYAIGFLAVLAEAGLERVAIISVDDVFSSSAAEGAQRWAADYRLEVSLFHVEPKDKPDWPRALRRARDSGAQALLLAGHFDEALQVRRTLKAIGWSPAAYYATVGPVLPQYQETLGADANGTFSTSQWEAREDLRHPGSLEFLREYRAAYAETPSYHAASAYAAGQILEQAILRAGSAERDAVRAALYALDTRNVIGRFAVDRTGLQAKMFPLIVQWQDNRREIVWPVELRTAAPVFVH